MVNFARKTETCNSLLEIPIKINQIPTTAIIDTGSSLSFISSEKLNLQDKEQPDKAIMIKFLDQTTVKIETTMIVDVEIKDKRIRQKFYVFNKMKFPVVLGMNFLKLSNISINFEEYSDNPFYALELNPELSKFTQINLEKDKIIGPRKEAVVYEFENHGEEIIEYFQFENNEMRYNYRAVLSTQFYPQLAIVVINLNYNNLYLPAKLNVGFVIYGGPKTENEANVCLSVPVNNILSKLKINREEPALIDLIKEFEFIFADEIKQLKRATNVKHVIDTGDSQPIRSVPYKTSYKEKELIEKEVKKMLEGNIIKVSHSPWSSPVVLVEKKDGSTRFCVDYRKLNAITKKDSGPLPLISDAIDALNDASIFTTLDCKSGYWCISLEESSKEKTAFVCHLGLFQFETMPFGLCCAPSTFQRYMSHVLSEYMWRFTLCYIDDLIIYSKTMEEHIVHLRLIFKKIAEHQLRLNPDKCTFASDSVVYLGHVISSEGVSPDPDKTASIENFPRPRRLRDVRSFLGLTSFYRKFVKGYSKIAKAMNTLLKKGQPFVWDQDCEQCFQELKQRLITPPILAHFKPDCPIILYTDACDYALGAVLSQKQDGKEVVISYNSKSLDECQKRYAACEKECLALVWAVTKLRQYLHGAHFLVKTDNCSLCYIRNMKSPNAKLMRWTLLLQSLVFDIQHKDGKLHRNADCLSRYPYEDPDEGIDEVDYLQVEQIVGKQIEKQIEKQSEKRMDKRWENLDLIQEQRDDDWCKRIVSKLENKNKRYLIGYRVENGLLYRVMYSSNREPQLLLCLPISLRLKVLEELHDSQISGHLGIAKTFAKVRSRFWWPTIEQNVREYINRCQSCQERKPAPGLPYGNCQNIDYPKIPFYMIGVDIMGKLNITPRKNQYIIVVIDFCTKFIEAKPLKQIRSVDIAEFFVNEILTRHGAVSKILTDRGKSFCSEFIENVYKLCKSQHVTTTSYHPETNGMAEHAIKTLRSMMSHYIDRNHTNWDLYLNKIVFAYNVSKQATTQESPFYLLYGREPVLPIDLAFELPGRFRFGRKYKESMEECFDIVKLRVENAQQKQKADYDMKHFNALFNVGDLVGLYKPIREKGKTQKLFKSFDGPYEIVRKIGAVSYEIKNVRHPRRQLKKVHIRRLKKWVKGDILGLDGPEIPFDEPDLQRGKAGKQKFDSSLKKLLGDDSVVSSMGSRDTERSSQSDDGQTEGDHSDVKRGENEGEKDFSSNDETSFDEE